MRTLLGITFLLLVHPGRAAATKPVPLEFSQVDLRDGRVLKDVIVKSYDAATGKLLVIASGKAMTIPIDQIPPPFSEALKNGAPKAGETVSTTGSSPPAMNLRPEVAGKAAPKSGTEKPTQVFVPKRMVLPPVSPAPEPRPVTSSASVPDPAAVARVVEAHRRAARNRADTYFRYEHQMGSNNISLTSLKIELDEPEAIQGWPGRYRTTGKAGIEYYDSKGGSFQRTTSTFEVITEQKGTGPVQVESFARKS
jgi:hypothetical protein